MQTLVTITSLELTAPQELKPGNPAAVAYTLLRCEVPSPAYNRFLYATVGADWYWRDRLSWSEEAWRRAIDRPEVATWVAYVQGAPAGYFELERQADGAVEISYFGLLPGFIGRGLGGALLTDAVREAWAFGANRVWLHTCTLDHPSALANYQARGFRSFNVEQTLKTLSAG